MRVYSGVDVRRDGSDEELGGCHEETEGPIRRPEGSSSCNWASTVGVESVRRMIDATRRAAGILRSEAEDFSQDAWLHLLAKRNAIGNAFEGRSTFETYLYSVLLNFARNWRRARIRRVSRMVPYDSISERKVARVRSGPRTPQEHCELRCHLEKVMAATPWAEWDLLWAWAAGRADERMPQEASANARYCKVSRTLRKVRDALAACDESAGGGGTASFRSPQDR